MIMFIRVYVRVVHFAVCLAIATALVSLAMAAWIVVFLIGVIHPRLTPRQSCDWFRELLRQSGRRVEQRGNL